MKRYITIPKAAKILEISRANAYALADNGELPTVQVGKQRRVPTDEFCKKFKVKEDDL